MGIMMEVKLTDGYQQRFTRACLDQIQRRKEESARPAVATRHRIDDVRHRAATPESEEEHGEY